MQGISIRCIWAKPPPPLLLPGPTRYAITGISDCMLESIFTFRNDSSRAELFRAMSLVSKKQICDRLSPVWEGFKAWGWWCTCWIDGGVGVLGLTCHVGEAWIRQFLFWFVSLLPLEVKRGEERRDLQSDSCDLHTKGFCLVHLHIP